METTSCRARHSHIFDIANRLINVGGVAQTWDNNGNLLSDGVFTYTYDSANRPITIKQGTTLTYTYSYNGLGDRVKQVVNGVPTTYTLDLNAGLTQVLVDGTNTYLYGNGRIAQQSVTTTAYFLGDALGSVRQLANESGAVTLARSYQPYGSVLSSAGTASSMYGWTGEQTDATGLIHLRARSYGPQWGRFISADTWGGDYRQPLTLNKWLYSLSNPVNYTDPSGHVACKDIISSWRSVFEALHLCDPNEQPTLTEAEREAFESLDPLNHPFTICGTGYTQYGFVCIPIAGGKSFGGNCGTKGPYVWRHGEEEQGEEEPAYCAEYLKNYKQLISKVNFLQGQIAELTIELAKEIFPDRIRKLQEAIRKLEEQLDEALKELAEVRAEAEFYGCDTSKWPPIPTGGGDVPVPVP